MARHRNVSYRVRCCRATTDVARIGSGNGVVAIGGSIAFVDENGDFLLDMIPGFLLIGREADASGAIAAVLDLISNEIQRGAMGTGIVAARLADVLVVEALRTLSDDSDRSRTGWLGAISDPRPGRALRAVHRDVAAAKVTSDDQSKLAQAWPLFNAVHKVAVYRQEQAQAKTQGQKPGITR